MIAFLVALVPRLALPWTGAGLGGTFGYDGSVYYAASASFLHGRMPYADYTLLHPPGIVLALVPFSGFGTLTTDNVGYKTAITAFAVLGAVNAALVARLVQRVGWGDRAALAGGLGYALWFGAYGAEFSVRLEPLGNFLVLLGLHALVRAEQRSGWRWPLLGGLALGAAVATKIWWTVPAVVILGGLLLTRERRRRAGWYAGGVAAGVVVIAGPFFAAAPSAMWRFVVVDQLHRARRTNELDRLSRLTGIPELHSGLPNAALKAIVAIGTLLLVAGCVAAWRARYGRFVIVLALVQLAVLLRAPTYYQFYDDYLAIALSLVGAAALRARVAPAAERAPARRWMPAAVAVVVAAVAIVDVFGPTSPSKPFANDRLRRMVAGVRCVMSNSPSGLIELNVLTSDLDHGCPNWVDVSGRLYAQDRQPGFAPHLHAARNAHWQRDFSQYLLGGERIVLLRAGTLVGPALHARLVVRGRLAHGKYYTLYR